MEALDLGLERGKSAARALNNEQIFLGGVDTSLPAIDGLDRRFQNVDAGGEAALDKGAREFAAFSGGAAGDEDDDVGCHSIGRATPSFVSGYFGKILLFGTASQRFPDTENCADKIQ